MVVDLAWRVVYEVISHHYESDGTSSVIEGKRKISNKHLSQLITTNVVASFTEHSTERRYDSVRERIGDKKVNKESNFAI